MVQKNGNRTLHRHMIKPREDHLPCSLHYAEDSGPKLLSILTKCLPQSSTTWKIDTLDIQELLNDALELGFPSDLLVMAMAQHLAPRVLQAEGCSSLPIEVCRSILQGCILSVCFTKVYLLKDMVRLVEKHVLANATIFVDDTASDTYADTLQETAEIVIPFTRDFVSAMKRKKLKISNKGAVVSNTFNRTKNLNKLLIKGDINYNQARSTRDLGISYTAAASRPS